MKIKPLDIGSLVISLAVVILVSAFAFADSSEPTQVSVQSSEGDFLYTLAQARSIRVEGPIGHTHIEIEGGRARVVASPCRDQICVAAGWLEASGNWTACLPNRVFVRVEGGDRSDGVDAQTY